ncbi:3-hydroxyacyl-CoA dehydrogenase [Amycolatopsis mediterranei S699]|uniref:3-hydroxyacyl-CoA dehydrogenase n=2 Tax=Amycolatopsis mediterranei TaxID=33910 RepID=A0A0H3D1C1_AMYMU|nr:3-hydroxyacyl-CoA dehydrogenase NAD-binding domain-containing protein [Amycolatopsis mediterranei]ADJ44425.1 3-hydroxyacyl-CoA dehydrogenase [Amycolatopsis mediterranei U32]AEK41163.1 3-hydroxyacyl-CoA dehydrogenase [Amycolatopsis mediterranei S699]AFO76137.1 3-hydroxyacyl-CoA dehydrogenase [Amycolatopsis mediterranei S699]AGT83266.1 3-hydroxyacyl-CoA dehydrogenase [Amycolatopsis mediterranei RB]KDO06657.1 3-hydroxyacyl-CoA dehydrogenase [Amycolatopsis mediterranei]
MTFTAEAAKAAFPDEVVTEAKTRLVKVPGLEKPVALITLDNGHDHTRPNTFGPQGLVSLNAALDKAFEAEPAAIAVTGKPFIFAVGADLSGVESVSDPELAREIAQTGHDVFRRLTESKIPTFGFVNGAVMGGGLELALSCHYRTLSENTAAIAFPEVFLGLFPGWGGTQLLPNLIGADAAVTVIIENALAQNKMLNVKQTAELGIVDAVFGSADYLEQSLLWLARVVNGEITPERREIDRGSGWDAAIARAKSLVDGRTHGASPGATKAVELLELARANDLDRGYAAETDGLAELLMSDVLRAGLYSFNLVNKRAKRPAGAPDKSLARKVNKVGIVGAGLMASQLALLFVRRLKVPVVLTDVDQERVDKGVGYVHAEIDKLLGKKRLSPDGANRLKALVTGSLDKAAFADADFVIEAVFEELGVKQQVFAELEQHLKPEAILATNTSSLSITAMASKLQHPERVVGFHFFNPVAVLPLLEIVRGERTDDASLATAFSVGKQLKKSSVLVKDASAFVVNRLLLRFLGEVLVTVDEGTPFEVADKALEPLGLPMTPLTLMQLVGPAIALHVGETLHESFPDRFTVSENLAKFVKAGKKGVWIWDAQGNASVDPEVAELWTQGDRPSTSEQVRERALSAIAEEIRIMLDEGVVAEAQDIDLCLILGAGWPFWNGGITPYLDRSGVSERVNGKPFLAPGVASVPAR